ncbi:ABC transporter substrate-binding protein [Actinomadura rubrisoli]|uniref:ABC transporter iron(III)/siderophore-binding protein n=1 Tax=Actinomadura rubrisoli TaxID=2530368 RepID=A0A4R5BSW2_9ACTN|nr:ABC transporter substrate-binding protein [Actinomadura rubrisoli]TDD90128.1 ABC transporter iron(III)/siderophore-binding protein [Actinomadura rubrisoli]
MSDRRRPSDREPLPNRQPLLDRKPRRRAALSALAALALAGAAACSGSSAGDEPTAQAATAPGKTSYPLAFRNCGQKVTFTRPPQRVLILNGTSVAESESFVLLGLQKHVLANAQSYGVSDDPSMVAAVKALPTRGLTMNKNFDVPAEQVLAAKPDLVVSTWSGGFDAKRGHATREQLAAAGITTLVNPVNCAYGKPGASEAEKRAYERISIESSHEFLALLGRVFDVQHKAAAVSADLRRRVGAVRARVAGRPARKVLIVYPGMSMMNAAGLPAVMTGRITDEVIAAAGGVNAFAGRSRDVTSTLTKEQLATARVDVVAVGAFTPSEDPAAQARTLFAEYPQWQASKTRTYTAIADGAFLGPLNAWAVEKLAKVVHPDG